jgi:anhydro-N-acetylmuramic acid kinase
LPEAPGRWLVTGGGRHNPALMAALRAELGVPVDPVESVGWNGDVLEAQAFAYLAVRSLAKLPLSVPGTTGVPHPMTGGKLDRAPARI